MEKYYTVKQIDDPDFGCEGLPEGSVAMATLHLVSETGQEMMVQEKDALLYELNILEGDKVWFKNGTICKE